MLPIIDPQPCRGKFREELWNNSEWWAEQKYHGCRYLLYSDGRLLSRHASVKGTGYVDKIDRTPHLAAVAKGMPPGTIFDGEVVTNDYGTVQEVTSILGSDPELSIYKQNTRGNLLFKVFDIPFHCGIDLRNGPLYERRQCLANIFDKYHYPFLSLSDIVPVNKRSYCDYVMKNGGEGVILKWRGAKYGEKKYWVKVKREETYDVFITGYQAADQYSKKVNGEISETKYYLNGWIGAVEIGMIDVITGNEVFVGTCSGFDESTRKYISCHKEECLGKVIEIKAQSQHKTGRFEHGRFEKWREDKHKSQCVLIPDIREG